MFFILVLLLTLGAFCCWANANSPQRERKLASLGVNALGAGLALGFVFQPASSTEMLVGILATVTAITLLFKSF